jgi:Ca2+-binding RTX toxin-like protein
VFDIDVAGVESFLVAPGNGAPADVVIEDLFETEVTTIDVELPVAGLLDDVEVDGREVADDIHIVADGLRVAVEGLSYNVLIDMGVIAEDRLTVNGLGGDDAIKSDPAAEALIDITLNGGDGDDFLSADAIINGGAGNDFIIGGSGDDVINGNDGDDIIDARGGTNAIDGGAGEDTFLVSGTAAGETISVTHLVATLTIAGGPSAGINNFDRMERVAVQAGEGSDTININTAVGGNLNYDILGGNPIGAVGDVLNVNSPTGLTFMAGPETDSGGFIDDDGAIISYDEIEDVGVTIPPAGPVVIMGTGADDDITAVGTAANTVDVTVNDGPTITYVGVTTLTLQGKEGDDDITIDVNNAVDVAFVVDGGPPTAGSDDLRVTGDDTINDNPVWTPDGVDGGDLALDSLNTPIDVSAIENLFYDGESNDENLTVAASGAAAPYTFEHQPGPAVDAGFMGIRNSDGERLGINYENLGSDGDITADATAVAAASLTALGTADDDEVDISFDAANAINLDLTSAYGTHVELLSAGVQVYEVQALAGNDDITVIGSVLATSLDVRAGGPGDSDSITFLDNGGANDTYEVNPGINSGNGSVDVNAVPTAYVGVEHLIFFGSSDPGDALTVNDDGGDNRWTVDAGPIGDQVQVDDRESIDYDNFNSVDLTNGFGTDTFTVHPTSLTGFDLTLTVNGDAGAGDDDVVTFVGTEADDTVTSGSDTVTVNGVTVTVGNTNFAQLEVITLGGDDNVDLDLDLTGVHKVVDLGAGDDDLDASGMQDGDFFGGIGNDVIVGSPLPDRIFGGAGNDILIGGGGVDFVYGQDGNDVIGGAAIGSDDPGDDFFFGGAGSDTFIWEPGDGLDTINGGDDGDDFFEFRGRGTVGDNLTLTADNGHVGAEFFDGTTLFDIDVAGVEAFLIAPGNGAPADVVIEDLFTTEAVIIDVELPVAGLLDDVTIHGREAEDDIHISPDGQLVSVQGLKYDVLIDNGVVAEDRLIVNGFGADDVIKATPGAEALIDITLNGGIGDDFLSADAIINGGPGNDFLQGGVGNDAINGNAGEDTIVGGAGNDVIDGGPGFDTILIQGTSGADVIDVFQAAPTTLNHTVNGVAEVDTLVLAAGVRTVEEAKIVGGDGADLIRVNWLDAHGVNANVDSLRMTVEGGSDATSDRLVVVDDGTDDLVLYRKGQANNSGTVQVGPGNAEPLLSVFSDVESVDFVDEAGAAIVNTAAGPQLVVFKHDPFESNNDRFTATYLGSGSTINVDPTIDPGPLVNPFGDGQDLPGDSDFYRVVAEATGTLDLQVYFRQVAALDSGRPGLPNDGNLDINVRDVDGNIIAGFGANDATDDERVRIPAVEGQTYYLEVIGNADAINIYNFSVVNHAPPVPYAIELVDNPTDGTTNPPGTSTNSDTGRSQFDNVTYDETPTLIFRLDDGTFLNDLPGNPATDTPPDEIIDIPFQAGPTQPTTAGFAIAIFDEGDTAPAAGNAGGLQSQQPLGFATQIEPGLYSFTVPDGSELDEGSHFLSARVQMIDPADTQQTGFGDRSVPLEIIVDRTPPEVFFGLATRPDDGLHPDSDSGLVFDSITNDLTPTFFGRAEANSIVRAYVDLDGDGMLTAADLLIGQTVAIPLDGTEQLETPTSPTNPGGQWELTSTVSMNDPLIVLSLGDIDGVRSILLVAEDVAGNITDLDDPVILDIFIDTQGPQVTDVFITDVPGFDLFDLKPETAQPTPPVDSLTIELRDLPARVLPFFYDAIENVESPNEQLAAIVLVGDHSGPIAIENVIYIDTNSGPGIATGSIVLTFDDPLPDDRFTLTLKDNIIDPAGNQLDGENNAAEPVGTPDFPTGDGIPGGDFIARFTVDSRPEIATWSQGVIYADINGNFVWDPEGQDNDATNRDFVYNFGEITDAYFAGNFAVGAASSGFDKPGAFGRFNGTYQFLLDTDDDGVGDLVGNMAFQVNAVPVAGNFSGPEGNAVPAGQRPRDEIGAYDGAFWYLDTDGNNQIDNDEQFATDLRGIPVVGDFNGDGFDDLATFNNDSGVFQFDLDRDGTVDDTLTFGFPGFAEKPVAGDFNLDGIDDIGLWVPGQEGQLPKNAGEFHILLSDDVPDFGDVDDPVTAIGPSNIFGPFSPAPLGNDLQAQFGDGFALPLVGNFDPPVSGNGGNGVLGSLTNLDNRFDTNRDGRVSALDALVVINAMAQEGFEHLDLSTPSRAIALLGGYQLDASGDGSISALDALQVINELSRQSVTATGEQIDWAASADSVIADLGDDDDDLLALLASDLEQQRVKA